MVSSSDYDRNITSLQQKENIIPRKKNNISFLSNESRTRSCSQSYNDIETHEDEIQTPIPRLVFSREKSMKKHASHLQRKLTTANAELISKESIVNNLIRRIKLMEERRLLNFIQDVTTEDLEPEPIPPEKQHMIPDSPEDWSEMPPESQIRYMEKELVSKTNQIIRKNNIIDDLLVHICMLERVSNTNQDDDIRTDRAVTLECEDGTDRRSNTPNAAHIIGMSIHVEHHLNRAKSRSAKRRKKEILLEVIAETESESNCTNCDDDYFISEKNNRTMIRSSWFSLLDSICGSNS
mmetsp:Transcript_10023/g.12715  ORF Transcript_10023/g.12715 Transcript_10023/m.12715 type:complete len:294 (+) Transcript_10023:189-1070(+)